MVGLGDLPGGSFSSLALGTSADGTSIVGSGQTIAGEEAISWTDYDGIRRLWDVLVEAGTDPAAEGWTALTRATAVSGNGRYVVGYGSHNGNTEAFLADLGTSEVPEPATWGAIGALLAFTGWRYVRRR